MQRPEPQPDETLPLPVDQLRSQAGHWDETREADGDFDTFGDPPPSEPVPGDRFGHYRLTRRLGAGGMGLVYEAYDESLKRPVALKLLRLTPRGLDEDSPQAAGLLEEAILQAKINHPHVAHIYFVGRQQGQPFLAMELARGGTLTEKLVDGPLPFPEVARVALQLAAALAETSRQGLIHGDIKPHNVLLGDDGQVKLSDFGLSRPVQRERERAEEGKLTGTADYIAPELLDGEVPNAASDMYALGVTLFQMTFGRLPYTATGDTLLPRLEAHRSAAVEFPEPWPESVPDNWRRLLARMLAKDPAERPDSFSSLLEELEPFRPSSLAPAGIFPRVLAWLVDVSLVWGVEAIVWGPLATPEVQSWLGNRPLLAWIAAWTTAIAPLLAALVTSWWGTTPGKRLFQLRVVDRHGQPPSGWVMGVRTFFPLLVLWMFSLTRVLYTMNALWLAGIIDLAAIIWLLFDSGSALLNDQRRTLHDVIMRTRVVLDTRVH